MSRRTPESTVRSRWRASARWTNPCQFRCDIFCNIHTSPLLHCAFEQDTWRAPLSGLSRNRASARSTSIIGAPNARS